MKPERLTWRAAAPPMVAIVALSIAALVAACQGNGHATVNAPTPIGPVLVDLWWCEQDQCIAATDPADTPQGVPMIARGVDLTVAPNVTAAPK